MVSGHWNLSFASKTDVSKIWKIITKIYLSCVQLINTSTTTKNTHIPRVLDYISIEVRKNFLDFLCLQAFMAKDVFPYLVQERKYFNTQHRCLLVLVNIIFKPNVSCPICIVLQEGLKTSNLTYYATTSYCQNWLYLSLRKGFSHITQQNELSWLQSKADRLWNKANGISTAKESLGWSGLDEWES